MYWDVKNLYGQAMQQKLPVNGFELRKDKSFDEEFIQNYDKESDSGYIL